MSELINGIGLQEAGAATAAAAEFATTDLYQHLKFQLFNRVLEILEQRGLSADNLDDSILREEIGRGLIAVVTREGMALNAAEQSDLVEDVRFEVIGLGPLEPLLRDTDVDDIIVNGPFRVYVERAGKLSRTAVRFRDSTHLMNIIQRIVSPIGRRVDEASPFVDARLADGSRVNIVIPPIALDGPMISIRKAKPYAMKAAEFVRNDALTREMLNFLASAIGSRLNILVCGGTGAGKTTLLNMLSAFIPETERLVTIEDAAELQLRQSHVARLETRPAIAEGGREISARDLMRNALRMRPDRIILGEVRGGEAVEMLQAMNTGHDGSMSTIHANNPRDALGRLELLLGFGGLTAEPQSLRRYISSSIQVLVQVQRMGDGKRRIVSITELIGVEGTNFTLNPLFTFEENPPLSGRGNFVTGAHRPFYANRLVVLGDPLNHVRVA